jgi:hypothetical protein
VVRVLKVPERASLAQPDAELTLPRSSRRHEVNGYDRVSGTHTIWLPPEPRCFRRLGKCDLPRYAEFCDRVQVVGDLTGLQRAAQQISAEATGR